MLSSRSRSRTAPAILGLLLAGCVHAAPVTTARPNPRAARALAADLEKIFAAAPMAQALWGVEVASLDSGRVLYARNPRTLMMPASNMKIVTLAAAAETLGWDYRFTTTLETAAPIEDGVLEGDLIVRGSGDPTINARGNRAAAVFDEWTAGLRAAGIRRIAGRIVGDDNAFDDRGLGQGWAWDYLQAGYAAPSGALQLNEDTATLTVRPGAQAGDAAVLDFPAGTGLTVHNAVLTAEPGGRATIDVDRPTDDARLEVSGAIAAGAAPITRDVAVVNPTVYFAQGVKDALAARGIAVSGEATDIDAIPGAVTGDRRALAATQSVPLRDIATVMMKVSQNLYAETLLKTIGAAKNGLGTAENGRAVVRGILAGWNIPESSYVQADGSGLSRYDYVTAEMIVTILSRLHGDARHREAFLATLPIAGRDGTIATRLRATRAEANALAKTGSIANVRALSGYVRTRDGETLAFSILANNFAIPSATVNWIADLAVETLANHSNR